MLNYVSGNFANTCVATMLLLRCTYVSKSHARCYTYAHVNKPLFSCLRYFGIICVTVDVNVPLPWMQFWWMSAIFDLYWFPISNGVYNSLEIAINTLFHATYLYIYCFEKCTDTPHMSCLCISSGRHVPFVINYDVYYIHIISETYVMYLVIYRWFPTVGCSVYMNVFFVMRGGRGGGRKANKRLDR